MLRAQCVLLLCSLALFSSGCDERDLKAPLACTFFREAVCERVQACSDLDKEECFARVFGEEPNCSLALYVEGELSLCSEDVRALSCDDIHAFEMNRSLSLSSCRNTRIVFPR